MPRRGVFCGSSEWTYYSDLKFRPGEFFLIEAQQKIDFTIFSVEEMARFLFDAPARGQ